MAEQFGSAAEHVGGLIDDTGLIDHVALIDLGEAHEELEVWSTFLRRFLAARGEAVAALSIFLISPVSPDVTQRLPIVSWGGRMRRLDVTIWADLHAPLSRVEPLASLAAALAVELGAWRLDIAAAIASAPYEGLLDPLSILEGWRGAATTESELIDGVRIECSVSLVERGAVPELCQRIWRAQLRALFPWIEDLRQQVLVRHRKLLVVDQQQKTLGAQVIEDLEFGGIFHQLRSKVPPVEADLLRALVKLRNDLAHHKPVAAGDLSLVLQNLKRAGYV